MKLIPKGEKLITRSLRSYHVDRALKDYSPIVSSFFNETLRLQSLGHKIKLTCKQAWNILLKQNFLCPKSGKLLLLDTAHLKRDGNAALDRKDRRKGFTYSNSIWVRQFTLQD